MTAREKERRGDSLLLVLLILLLGFICIILAGGWALRFAPNWRLPANMGSNLNPDSVFLTNQPVDFFEPLDPDILASPPWFDTFLTPGAVSITRTPPPQPTVTVTPFILPPRTNTLVPSSPTPSPTPFIPFPTNAATRTPSGPGPTRTPTHTPSNTPIPVVDLQITKTDGVSVYNPGASLTYTIVVTNNGPSGATGAIVIDLKPVQVTTWSWVCQSQTNGASGCDGLTNSTKDFTDTVNLPNGASITYLVTAQTAASASGNLVNTASVTAPVGTIETNTANNSATDQDTPELVADLQVTKTDNATTYAPNMPLQYVIVAFNSGPSDVTGAIVGDTFPMGELTNITWTCSGSGGASCTAAGTGDISDTVNLPAGGSVTYIVDALVNGAPATITNTAKVTQPPGVTDSNPGNNSATDTDQLITSNSMPYGNIDSGRDLGYTVIPADTSLTLTFPSPLIADGDGGWDLAYYEILDVPPDDNRILMDCVILQISDGSNWYTIFNWCNGSADANSNIPIPLPSPPNLTDCAGEPDNCAIYSSFLYDSTGVLVDIDPLVPDGSYPYIRIISPPNPPGTDTGTEVDGIEILP